MQSTTKGLKNWFIALRPKTLTAAIGPTIMATTMAYSDGLGNLWIALVCLITALLLQIGTNLANDYYDFIKGSDREDRIGPTRVTQAGLITPEKIRFSFILCFILAAVGWGVLAYHAGWVMLVLAVTSILSGIYYTAGSKALGYIGLGDIFVFIFFGPVAVTGIYYAQSLQVTSAVLLAGIAPGLLSVAILTVNNLRDIDSDQISNKRTLVVRFGVGFARAEYLFCVIGAAIVPIILYFFFNREAAILLPSLSCLLLLPVIKVVLKQREGSVLNKALARTGGFLLLYCVLFSLCWFFSTPSL